MKRRKRTPILLISVIASMLFISVASTVSAGSVYQEYHTDGISQPIVTVLMQGLSHRVYPWDTKPRKGSGLPCWLRRVPPMSHTPYPRLLFPVFRQTEARMPAQNQATDLRFRALREFTPQWMNPARKIPPTTLPPWTSPAPRQVPLCLILRNPFGTSSPKSLRTISTMP